jgi:hypothetical protein
VVDAAEAEVMHCLALPPTRGFIRDNQSAFDLHLEKMARKQRLHAGDRLSDPQLRRLDDIIGLTSVLSLSSTDTRAAAYARVCLFRYPGKEADIVEIEDRYITHPILFDGTHNTLIYKCTHICIHVHTRKMLARTHKYKQYTYIQTHTQTHIRADTHTYTHTQTDIDADTNRHEIKQTVQQAICISSSEHMTSGALEKMKKKQTVHIGDRSNEALRSIDALIAEVP